MSLTRKQQILYDFLKKRAANNAIKISNIKISKELVEQKLIFPAMSFNSVSTLLRKLENRGLIKREEGHTTRDRIIIIL